MSSPEIPASVFFSAMQAVLVNSIFDAIFHGSYRFNNYWKIAFYMIVVLVSHLFFVRKREKIIDKYKNETKQKSILGYIVLALFTIGIFVFAIIQFSPKN